MTDEALTNWLATNILGDGERPNNWSPLTDLNACREIEIKLRSHGLAPAYMRELMGYAFEDGDNNRVGEFCVFATARTRCCAIKRAWESRE